MGPKNRYFLAKIWRLDVQSEGKNEAVRSERGGYIYKWTGVSRLAKSESATEWRSKIQFQKRFRAAVT